MSYVLNIEVNSEAETRFTQLMNKVGAACVDKELGVVIDGVTCNRYTIDDTTYKTIRNYLHKERV